MHHCTEVSCVEKKYYYMYNQSQGDYIRPLKMQPLSSVKNGRKNQYSIHIQSAYM